MIDTFLNNFFGMTKRLWYLIAFTITICGIGSIIGYYFSDRSDRDWMFLACLAIFVPLPFAKITHLTSHWIVWGKLK